MNDQARTSTKSELLYNRAKKVLPGGVSRNTVLRATYPSYVAKGEGYEVTDVDGVTRIDFSNNMTSLIHGHAYPPVVEAVCHQITKGSAFTLATESEVEFAEHMCGRSSALEMIRFVNSGTEAVMSCLKAARAYTGRPKIAKVEGAYHGLYDYAEVSQTAKPSNWGNPTHPASVPVSYGTPPHALEDVVVIPFNDPTTAISILDAYADELACILLDPMPHRVGLTPATGEFVHSLRAWCDHHDALLIFDEVITFRSEHAGAQAWYEDTPDLTAMGKIIGGGFPVGALGGRRDVMNVMNPLAEKVLFPHSGTFSANPVTMIAGLTAMNAFDQQAVEKINRLGDRARAGIEDAIATVGIPACVTGRGSLLRLHMKPVKPCGYRDAFVSPEESRLLRVVLDHLYDSGFIVMNTCSAAISTVMSERQIDDLVESVQSGLHKAKSLL